MPNQLQKTFGFVEMPPCSNIFIKLHNQCSTLFFCMYSLLLCCCSHPIPPTGVLKMVLNWKENHAPTLFLLTENETWFAKAMIQFQKKRTIYNWGGLLVVPVNTFAIYFWHRRGLHIMLFRQVLPPNIFCFKAHVRVGSVSLASLSHDITVEKCTVADQESAWK